ncbi:MAG TPA: hypothetical protein VK618_10950 [Flavitalea sp.]|nr:hypothetical protein [Flavitalea sp.]
MRIHTDKKLFLSRWILSLLLLVPAIIQLQAQEGSEVFYIRARITDAVGKQGLNNLRCFLSVPGKQFELSTAVSDSSGTVIFPLRDPAASRQIVLQPGSLQYSSTRFQLSEPYYYYTDSLEQDSVPEFEKDSLPFYGIADKTYFLDNYTRFPTIKEVLTEFIPEIRTRRDQISVLNTPYHIFFENEPLLLVDGIIANSSGVLKLDPLKIQRIEVIARKYYFGSLVCEGIVCFRTYEGDFAGYPLEPSVRVADYNGVSYKRKSPR